MRGRAAPCDVARAPRRARSMARASHRRVPRSRAAARAARELCGKREQLRAVGAFAGQAEVALPAAVDLARERQRPPRLGVEHRMARRRARHAVAVCSLPAGSSRCRCRRAAPTRPRLRAPTTCPGFCVSSCCSDCSAALMLLSSKPERRVSAPPRVAVRTDGAEPASGFPRRQPVRLMLDTPIQNPAVKLDVSDDRHRQSL